MVSRTLFQSSLRSLTRSKLQSVLSILGIALGVAIVLAVDLANTSAQRAFQLSVSAITGTATHQIVGAERTIDQNLYVDLRRKLGIRRSAPVLEGRVDWQGDEFRLVGIDPISESAMERQRFITDAPDDTSDDNVRNMLTWINAVAISAKQASKHGLRVGDTINVKIGDIGKTLKIAAKLDNGSNPGLDQVLIADMATAQELLGVRGMIHRIDLVLTDDQVSRLKAWLPPSLLLQETRRQHTSTQAMSQAFQTNLFAMSLLSLLVGGLLIYSTATFAFLKRRKDFGIFLGLGVSPREIATVLLLEILVIALIASVLGLLLGFGLSKVLVGFITQTINDLYFNLTVTEFSVSVWVILKCAFLGIATSIIATAIPIAKAINTAPISLQRHGEGESSARSQFRTVALAGVALFALGYLLSEVDAGGVGAGFVALTALTLGYCFCIPFALTWLSQLASKIIGRLRHYRLLYVFRAMETSVSRTGVACAAFAVAISTVIGVTIMISGFRDSVDVWLGDILDADIYISIPRESAPEQSAIQNLDKAMLNHATVRATRTTHFWRVNTQLGNFRAGASEATDGSIRRREWLEQSNQFSIDWNSGLGVAISEPLAYHQGLKLGDILETHTVEGAKPFPIIGVYRDYGSSQGMILFPPSIRARYWPGLETFGLAVYLKDGEEIDKADIRSVMDANNLTGDITDSAAIRNRSIEIFDRTFAITHVLRLLVLIVAFVGVLSAMLALQLERLREYAMLRASGLHRKELASLILGQSALLGLYAAIFAIPYGILTADRLIHVINRRSFGWSMDGTIDPAIFPQALLLGVVAATIASIYPAMKSGRRDIAAALREE